MDWEAMLDDLSKDCDVSGKKNRTKPDPAVRYRLLSND